MATSRFDKFLTSDYNMQFYQPQSYIPNFELLGKSLLENEAEKDKFDQLSQVPVDYLKDIHNKQALEVQNSIDNLKNSVTEAFASGNINFAKAKLRDAQLSIRNMWQPGGKAYELAAAKKAYIEKANQIEKDVKGDNNRKYALHTLKQGTIDNANKDLIQVGSPEIIDLQDYYKDAHDLVKDLHATDLTSESDYVKYASSRGINIAPRLLMKIKKITFS